jgi:hypothetical protein
VLCLRRGCSVFVRVGETISEFLEILQLLFQRLRGPASGASRSLPYQKISHTSATTKQSCAQAFRFGVQCREPLRGGDEPDGEAGMLRLECIACARKCMIGPSCSHDSSEVLEPAGVTGDWCGANLVARRPHIWIAFNDFNRLNRWSYCLSMAFSTSLQSTREKALFLSQPWAKSAAGSSGGE